MVLARRFHPLLGRLTDAEIARRAGCSESTVLAARRTLGIPARRGRESHNLDAVSPADLLKQIRARARSGKSMRAYELGSKRLVRLAQRHFGGWYQAVEAAGLKPAGRPRKVVSHPSKRLLTAALLRGPKTAAELERLTGVSRDAIRGRRKTLGVARWEKPGRDRSWLPRVRKFLGKLPDAEVGKRAGRSPGHVTTVRQELGIPAALRFQSIRIRQRDLRGLHRTDALILRERYMRKPPATLPELARRLGVSKQRVAQREKRGLKTLGML